MNRYLWVLTVQWTRVDGERSTLTLSDIEAAASTAISRREILNRALQVATTEHDVPADPAIMFFSVEPDLLMLGLPEGSQ